MLAKSPGSAEIEQIVSLRLVCYWRKHSRAAYFPKWLTLLPFLLSTSDKEVYSVSLFIYIPLPKISPNKAYLMIYSLLKGKLIYNNHLIINFLKGGFETGIHNNKEIWLFQRGHICYPFCTVEEKKPAEPRWSWTWHNCFEVLFVFTGWPTSCWKESPSPIWSHSKIWRGKGYKGFRCWVLQRGFCSTEVAPEGSALVQTAESQEVQRGFLRDTSPVTSRSHWGGAESTSHSARLSNSLQHSQVAAVSDCSDVRLWLLSSPWWDV